MATKPPGKEKFKAPLKGTPKHTSPPSSRVLYLIMALVAVVILVGGYLFYRDQAQQMHQRIEGGLSIVAQLKADQIAEWRTERLTDADMLVGSPFFAEGVEKYLASPTDTEAKDKVLARLAVIKKAYPYQDMLLTDVNGKVLLSLNDSVPRLSDMTLAQLPVAIKERKAVMVDFHYPPDSNFPHLDVVAPLFPWGQDSPQAIGAVVFCIDPSQYLYPLLQSSPMPSETAETLLVERDGDQVLFLNELRHQKDTALKLRIPLSQQEVPAVMAVLGKEGVVEGKDYRGVEVLSALKHIPDSPWYMVAKIDTSEAISAGRFRTGMTMALVAGLLAAALAGIGFIWQRRQRLAYQALYQAGLETQALRSHFEYLVKYANDIIYLTDENYHIVEVNDRALEAYGYTRQEMLGMPLAALISPGGLSSYQARLRKIQQKGTIVAEGIHQRKDGSTFPVEVSGRSMKIEDKTYIQGIVRDITERKQAEEFLLLSEQNFRDSIENSPLGIRIADSDGKTIYANRALLDIWGYSNIEELEAVPRKQRYTPESYDEHRERTKKRRQGEFIPTNYEISIVRKDGDVRHLAASRGEVLWDGEKQFQVVYQDITEREQAEGEVQEERRKLKEAQTMGKIGNWEYDVDSQTIIWSDEAYVLYERDPALGPPNAEEEAKYYSADQARILRDYAARSIENGEEFRYDLEAILPSGKRAVFAASMSSIINESGRVIKLFGTVQDITERKRAEETLRESEERFRALTENSSDIVTVIDSLGIVQYQSPNYRTIWGREPNGEIGRAIFNDVHPDDMALVGEKFNYLFMNPEATVNIEIRAQHQDGSWRTIDVVGRNLLDHPAVRGIVANFRDITEHKKLEQEIKQNYDTQTVINSLLSLSLRDIKLEEILEHTIDLILSLPWLTFESRGNIFLVEDDPEVLIMKARKGLSQPIQEACARVPFGKCLCGRAALAREIEFADCLDERHETRYDGIGPHGHYCIPIIYAEKVLGVINLYLRESYSRDEKDEEFLRAVAYALAGVIVRKRAEEALQQSEERYRAILKEIADSYFEVDLAGNLTFVNDAVCHNLGYSREELLGMNYRDFTAEESIKSVYQAFNQVHRTGKPNKGFPWKLIRKDGSIGFADNSASLLRSQTGEIIGFRGVGRDITERKMAEEERKQLELKAQITSRLASVGEMAAGVAHEINNPLTAVTGYAQLLVDREDVPSDIRSDLAAINDGARRVADIVRTLLAFSRQTKPQRKLVDINELIESTLILRAYHLRVNNIEVVTRLAPDLLETVVDPGQIQQVLLNLIVNAEMEMKLAHDTGKLTITTKKSHNTIKICFQDNGPGIKPEVMDKIFNPFFTTREVGQGTGLGLSLCYGIVAEHKGRIYAESKPGKGATFVIELPVVTEVAPPKPAKPDVKKPEKAVKARILVVDDEQVVRDVVNRVLTGEGHKVDAVDNAVDALKKIESQRYKLILVDIKMPGMDGVTLYKRIEKINKPLARRVVFITGDIMGADTEKFLAETKVAHIDKPFNAEQLSREVQRALTGGR